MKLSLFFPFIVIFLLLTPIISFANGGDQRVVEGKYLINLSRSPFTPKAGENLAMIASFVDIQTGRLIEEDLIVKVRVAKFGEGRSKREFLLEQENMTAKRGILEFQYTFTDPGLHEIFFDFAFSSNPQKVYNAPDFLLDIQKADAQNTQALLLPLVLLFGLIGGFAGGWFVKKKNADITA